MCGPVATALGAAVGSGWRNTDGAFLSLAITITWTLCGMFPLAAAMFAGKAHRICAAEVECSKKVTWNYLFMLLGRPKHQHAAAAFTINHSDVGMMTVEQTRTYAPSFLQPLPGNSCSFARPPPHIRSTSRSCVAELAVGAQVPFDTLMLALPFRHDVGGLLAFRCSTSWIGFFVRPGAWTNLNLQPCHFIGCGFGRG